MTNAAPISGKRHTREIFTREFLALATINLAMFFGFQMITVGLPVYVAQLGADSFMVGVITSTFTIVATLVRVFAGAVLDRFGRVGAMVTGIALMLCSIVAYAIFPFVGVILGIRLLHGLGWGFGSTATSTVAADIIPKKRFAEGMGYFAMTNAVASALAPALSIFLVQGVGGVYMLGVSASFTLLALVFIGLSDSLPMFCLAGAFAGLGIGTAMGTFQAMAVATVPPYRRGVATSTYFVFFDLGIAIGSFVAGILAGAFGYATMFEAIAVFPILGCIFFLVAGKRRLATTRPNAETE